MDIKKNNFGVGEREFIDDIASLLEPWGMPTGVGRVWGYLLLCDQPVALETIAQALQMSRSGAWNAARNLETFGHVRRFGTPGSKRALYAHSDNFGAPMEAQSALLGSVGERLEACAANIARGGVANQLKARARFYRALRASIDATIDAQMSVSRRRPRPRQQRPTRDRNARSSRV